MWSAIITSAATIAAVLYIQGPIVALALTAVSSLAMLVVLRAAEQKPAAPKLATRSLEIVGKSDDVDLLFPPLRQQAS